ncbi:hypothetical protein EVAR_58966_1 [Eumeta japonica]|uniref:Uncharacterized protein n=1 Tax=Eumeta variegata TaxID=151549 RepID=A0A4C1YI24_EUMVA|nr:hypothetical protein EVAR_58966_1 [Eumeta japonica]
MGDAFIFHLKCSLKSFRPAPSEPGSALGSFVRHDRLAVVRLRVSLYRDFLQKVSHNGIRRNARLTVTKTLAKESYRQISTEGNPSRYYRDSESNIETMRSALGTLLGLLSRGELLLRLSAKLGECGRADLIIARRRRVLCRDTLM